MEDNKNYVGKVIKVYSQNSTGPVEYIGIVYSQLPDPWGPNPKLSLLLTNGTTFSPSAKNIQRITATRIPEDLRNALTAGCKALQSQIAFEQEYKEKQCLHREAVAKAIQVVKESSPDLSSNDFMKAVNELFSEKYPSSGSYYLRYFTCSSLSKDEITMTHVQDVEKYVSPKAYSFISEEYDRTLYIERSDPNLAWFCDQQAPAVLPELSKYERGTGASIGDKNWLSAHRNYTFPLKHGYSKQSLEEIRNILQGISPKEKTKVSLNEQIQRAHARSSQSKDTGSGKENRVKKHKEGQRT